MQEYAEICIGAYIAYLAYICTPHFADGDLGAGYRQILRDGWVHYLPQKNAAGGPGQSAWRVDRYERQDCCG